MKYYSVIGINVLIHEKIWMNFKCLLKVKEANMKRLHTIVYLAEIQQVETQWNNIFKVKKIK